MSGEIKTLLEDWCPSIRILTNFGSCFREVRAQQRDIDLEEGGGVKRKSATLSQQDDSDDEEFPALSSDIVGDGAGEQLEKELDVDPADSDALNIFMNNVCILLWQFEK